MKFKYFFKREEAGEATSGGTGPINYTGTEMFNQTPVKPEVKPETPVVETKPLFEGAGGKFNTPAELAEYTKKLEERAIASEIEKGKVVKTPTTEEQINSQAAQVPDMSNVDVDEMFTDPKGYLEKFEEKILAKVDAAKNAEANTKTFWDNFYEENPELKNHSKVVDLIRKDKWNEVKDLPIADAKKKLANDARVLIKSIQGQSTRTEEVEHSTSETLGSSQVGDIGGKKPVEGKVISFADQLKKLKNRG